MALRKVPGMQRLSTRTPPTERPDSRRGDHRAGRGHGQPGHLRPGRPLDDHFRRGRPYRARAQGCRRGGDRMGPPP
eukprot:756933-Lingulodinium_polyedra.AAC.1